MGFAMVTECNIDRDSDDIHECFNQGQVVKVRTAVHPLPATTYRLRAWLRACPLPTGYEPAPYQLQHKP